MSGELTGPNEPYFDHPEDYGFCPHCGGDGYVFECFDGCCADADMGCDLCTKRCEYCNPAKPALSAQEDKL